MKLDLLKFRGDFCYNVKVLKSGGELVVLRRRRATDLVSYHDYILCVYCLAFVTKQEMRRHLKTCLNKDNENRNNNIVEQSEMLLYANKFGDGTSKELKALVLENMIRDEVYDWLVKDRLILTYGSCLLGTVAGFKEISNIPQRMRVTSRLLIKIRKSCGQNDLTLSDCLCLEKFDAVVEAAIVLGGCSMENEEGEMVPTFKTPSLALIIRYSFEKCTALQNEFAIKEKNPSGIANAKDFLKLYKLELSGKI